MISLLFPVDHCGADIHPAWEKEGFLFLLIAFYSCIINIRFTVIESLSNIISFDHERT